MAGRGLPAGSLSLTDTAGQAAATPPGGVAITPMNDRMVVAGGARGGAGQDGGGLRGRAGRRG